MTKIKVLAPKSSIFKQKLTTTKNPMPTSKTKWGDWRAESKKQEYKNSE